MVFSLTNASVDRSMDLLESKKRTISIKIAMILGEQ